MLWLNVAESLPNYRLSKFRDVVQAAEREMLAGLMLDVGKTQELLAVGEVGR
ncbi:MAG: hypothetical protein R3B72_38115 [Polyangiaceae bacterium]